MMKIYKIFLVIVLVAASVSCGERNKEFDAPNVDGEYRPYDDSSSRLYFSEISYDVKSQQFMLILTDNNGSSLNVGIDFKNNLMMAMYPGKETESIKYKCIENTASECTQFEISGFPFDYGSVKFFKKYIEIIQQDSGKVTVQPIFKIEKYFSTSNFLYLPKSQNKEIGYIQYGSHLIDNEEKISVLPASLPGELPLDESFYFSYCVNLEGSLDNSLQITCQFTEKISTNVEVRSWQLKILN